jgi:protein-L-isoaspartate(D-aspartate) O-methyltransferase
MTGKEELVQMWQGMLVKENILQAFKVIPREIFVPPQFKDQAYDDQPLPTLREQSISQPTTIMVMLQALDIKSGENVLEIGAGVGYQAALIGEIIGEQGHLVTCEVIPELVYIAQKHLHNLGLSWVNVIEADGGEGWLDSSPYDKVIITAACPAVPQPVVDQLREGGIVIAPVGDLDSQTMVRGVKVNGKLELEFLGPFRFVPMVGKHGFQDLQR